MFYFISSQRGNVYLRQDHAVTSFSNVSLVKFLLLPLLQQCVAHTVRVFADKESLIRLTCTGNGSQYLSSKDVFYSEEFESLAI
jgi:hypothetical protein